MMHLYRLYLVVALIGSVQGQCSVAEGEVEVYNAALSHLLGRISVLILEDKTRYCRDLREAGPDIYRDSRPIWVEYLKANEAGSCALNRELSVAEKHDLLPRERIQAYFTGENFEAGWKRFHADYTDRSAYASVSRVGFAEEGQKAFLYIEYVRGWHAGSGNYVLLRKAQGRWLVLRVWRTWES